MIDEDKEMDSELVGSNDDSTKNHHYSMSKR